MSDGITIRPYAPGDWDAVWAMLEPIFRAGETYAVAPDITSKSACDLWTGNGKSTFVAVDESSGEILGTYYLRRNHDGGGSHVCNCGYAVSEGARGRGVAATLCEHSQAEAASRGYWAMQFNFVVSSNEVAVRLWKKLGFEIVGTLPAAFRHPGLGFVDVYVMYKRLERAR